MTGFFHLYADDTIFIHHNASKLDLVRSLNNEITNLSSWLNLNKLTLNLKKTEAIFFGDARRVKECDDLEINLDGATIENKGFVKYLGVYIDQKLNWKKHISIVRGKGYNKFNQIRSLVNILTPETKTLLVNSLVMPYLNYCSIVWGSASHTALSKLESLHLKSSQLTNKPLLTFYNQHLFNKSIFAFKILNNIAPSHLLNKLVLVKHRHSYNTRDSSSNKTVTALKGNRLSAQLIEQDVSSSWNNLPNELRKTPSLLQFKTNMKKYLL